MTTGPWVNIQSYVLFSIHKHLGNSSKLWGKCIISFASASLRVSILDPVPNCDSVVPLSPLPTHFCAPENTRGKTRSVGGEPVSAEFTVGRGSEKPAINSVPPFSQGRRKGEEEKATKQQQNCTSEEDEEEETGSWFSSSPSTLSFPSATASLNARAIPTRPRWSEYRILRSEKSQDTKEKPELFLGILTDLACDPTTILCLSASASQRRLSEYCCSISSGMPAEMMSFRTCFKKTIVGNWGLSFIYRKWIIL